MYYGLEACSLCKTQFGSLDVAINSTFKKFFDNRSVAENFIFTVSRPSESQNQK